MLTELAKQHWIGINDRLPENNQTVIVFDNKVRVCQFFQADNDYCFLDISPKRIVTHWHPLPEPPKSE